MRRQSALISVLSMLGFTGLPAPTAAHEAGAPPQIAAPVTCLEPLKPMVAAFVEAGTEDDLRQEFELYFKEVETYLNCLNSESGRVRADAREAANEYSRVLDRIPPPPYEAEPDVILQEPMVSSGRLNLDYRGGGS